jgi:VIT1/CCC1 family predicted Fe2+/Mn2+ transporter
MNKKPFIFTISGAVLIMLSYIFRLTHLPGVWVLIICGLSMLVPGFIYLIKNKNKE